MHNFFYAINTFVHRSKFLSAIIAVAFIASLLFFASRIGFEENITQLIPTSDQSDITAKVLDQVNFADKISIMVTAEKGGTPDDLANYATEFLDSIEVTSKPFIGEVQGKIDEENIQETFDFVYSNLPLFLDHEDYAILAQRTNPDSISKSVESSYKSLVSPTGMVTRDFILKDPLGITFMALKKLQQLSVGDDFTLHNGFVLTKDRTKLLLFITPKLPANETDRNTVFIDNLNRIQSNLNKKYNGRTQMTFFGATPVAVANATQIKADVMNTSIFAAVSLMLLLAYFYRSGSTPFIIFVPSIVGTLFALAMLYFIKGTISIIALGISSILLGETTDYSIYVLTHLRNNKNVRLLYRDISKPLILCGVTTAVTFMCLLFIKSEALKDLGIFAALSVVSTSIFSLILIPLL
ncbi:MAG TPA: MMPL family transporter, partial [Flavobacterium sp.]